MDQAVNVLLIALGLFSGMILCLEIGRRMGTAHRLRGGNEGAGAGVLDGAVFALLGLLLSFTFSGASARFDQRRELIIEETNNIGTAWLRLDLLPVDSQPGLRDSFRRYLDARIEVYRRLPDIDAAMAQVAEANRLQGVIWRKAIAAVQGPGTLPAAPVLLMPALNAMFDISTTRTLATRLHPPAVVFVMLFGLALASSLIAGFGMTASRRSWIHMLGFALVVALSVYVIIDIEYPRLGMIRVDEFDRALIELRATMNP